VIADEPDLTGVVGVDGRASDESELIPSSARVFCVATSLPEVSPRQRLSTPAAVPRLSHLLSRLSHLLRT
jgi:hypothetical protein